MSTGHGLTCDCGQTFATVAGLQAHLNEHVAETLYAVINPAVPESENIVDDCETLRDVPFVELQFADSRCCEFCNRRGGYYRTTDPYGEAMCRFHLEQQPAVAAIVDSKDDINPSKLPEPSVQNGE